MSRIMKGLRGAPGSRRAPGRSGARGGAAAMEGTASPVKRGIALSVLAMLVVGLFAGLFGGASAAFAADDDEKNKFAFYKVTSALSGTFANATAPDAKDNAFQTDSAAWGTVMPNAGSAGSFLAYTDPNIFEDFKGWGAAQLSMATTNVSYDKLRLKDESGKVVSTKNQGMLGYAYYGSALNQLGVDSTKTGGGFDIVRPIGGGLMFLAFVVSWVIDMFFNGVVGFLSVLNPFKLFVDGMKQVGLATGLVDSVGGQGTAAFNGFAKFASDLYAFVSNLGWVLIPIFIGFLLLSLFFLKQGQRGGKIKQLVIRVMFIGLGVPLLGMMYTGTLDAMHTDSVARSNGSARVVASTYVDFGSWATNTRLAPPSGMIKVDPNSGKVTGDTFQKTRSIALAINGQGNSSMVGLGGSGLNSDSVNDLNSKIYSDMTSTTGDGGADGNLFADSVSMLTRYMAGSQVSSSSFESAYSNTISSMIKDGKVTDDTAEKWFSSVSTEKWEDIAKGEKSELADNPLIKAGTNPLVMGADGKFSGGIQFNLGDLAGSRFNCAVSVDANGLCAMSPLAIYNYMNTSFDETSMTMYSSGKSSSDLVRKSHMEVNLVGSGAMSLLYWVNSMTILISFIVIGLAYTFALLFASIKRSFNLIGAIPFAMVGFMGGIAKVIVYSIALIVEVVMTIAAYMMIQQFLLALPTIIETPMQFLSSAGGGVGKFIAESAFVIPLISSLLSTIIVIVFTVMALKVRKGLVKAVEEGVTKIVNRFTDTSVSSGAGGGGLAPALAGGLAAGAGAAAANKLMGGGAGGGAAGGSGDDSGPGSIGVGSDMTQEGDVSDQNAALTQGGDDVNAEQNQLEGGDSTDIGGSTIGTSSSEDVYDADGNLVSSGGEGGDSASGGGMMTADQSDRAVAEGVGANGLPTPAALEGPKAEAGSAGGTGGGDGGSPAAATGGPQAQPDGGQGPHSDQGAGQAGAGAAATAAMLGKTAGGTSGAGGDSQGEARQGGSGAKQTGGQGGRSPRGTGGQGAQPARQAGSRPRPQQGQRQGDVSGQIRAGAEQRSGQPISAPPQQRQQQGAQPQQQPQPVRAPRSQPQSQTPKQAFTQTAGIGMAMGAQQHFQQRAERKKKDRDDLMGNSRPADK